MPKQAEKPLRGENTKREYIYLFSTEYTNKISDSISI
jgi:hypothetical protein